MGEERFDVCIIGSGFAGSVIADDLASTGKRIAIVEAGDWQDRQANQRTIANGRIPLATPPELHTPVSVTGNLGWRRGWSYGVGGHTPWTAWALRPFENHFKMRSLYGVGEDWPLDYDDLEPDYCRAEDELGVSGDSAIKERPRRSHAYPMPPFPFSYADHSFIEACSALGISTNALPVARNRGPRRGRDACCFSGSCESCPTTAKYRADLVHVPSAIAAKNVKLFTRTMAIRLQLDEHGRAERLVCAMPDRTTVSVAAGIFVVACNTIESTRLLLNSATATSPRGLANSSGVAGRYLIDHMDTGASAVAPKSVWAQRTTSAVVSRHFEDGPQRKEHGGFTLTVGPQGGTDVSGDALQLVERGLFGTELKKKLLRQQTTLVWVGGSVEMLATAENRVELDPANRDHFGRPGLKIAFNHGDYEARAVAAMKAAVVPILNKMGCTQIDGPDLDVMCGFHQMGTLRMGKDPARSVVDPNLRTHDVDNLYVASSATYPNSLGPVNPTLTLVALSYRLARHLRQDVLR